VKWEKREKLVVIGPSGKEYEIGFLSPCTDGVVIGTTRIGDKNPPHLTLLKKDEGISSHITYQDHSVKPQWFPPATTSEVLDNIQVLLDKGIIFQIGSDEYSLRVVFLTKKLEKCFNRFMAALYQKRVLENQVIHILNIKNVLDMLPDFIHDLREHPSDYFGLCQVKDLLEDDSKVLGMTESGLVMLHAENELIGMRMNYLLGASFMGVSTQFQGQSALNEVYQSFGVSQYVQEIFDRKYLENLFSSEAIDKGTNDRLKALTES
jgi:mRNA-degrading endonuclease HigB of HigAB toxin-antitoxin module